MAGRNGNAWTVLIFGAMLGLALVLTAMPSAPVLAQNSQTLFQRLFKSDRKKSRVEQPAPQKPRVTRRKRRTGSAVVAKPESPDKLENARIVLVVGDFLSGGLAEGLETAFASSPGVRIVDHSNGSSGLVRDDYYSWYEELPRLLQETKPVAVVIMIGANDRQDFRTTSPRLKRGTEPWMKEYEQRAARLTGIVTERNLPLAWVGVPSFKSRRASSDMVAFNDIYKRTVTAANGAFVDIWDGFVSETGAFVTTGPDINGQPARLRAGDGINVTRAGRRKIAFYAEKPLRKILGDAASPDIGVLGAENLPSLTLNPLGIVKIDRTTPVSLDDPALDGGDELLGETVTAAGQGSAEKPIGRLTLDGVAPPAKPGRADDFTWKPAGPETASQ